MPESKHRKKKRQKKAGAPLPKSVTAAPKKKITRQQIAIYVISALVVISMAVGILLNGGSRRPPVPTSAPVDVESLFTETPAPAEATTEPSAE